MKKINLGDSLLKVLISDSASPVPLALVDEEYWVYLSRYRGESGPRVNARDLFCLVIEGEMEVRSGDETLSLEKGEAFLAEAGVAWSVSAEASGATAIHFECRSQETAGVEEENLEVM